MLEIKFDLMNEVEAKRVSAIIASIYSAAVLTTAVTVPTPQPVAVPVQQPVQAPVQPVQTPVQVQQPVQQPVQASTGGDLTDAGLQMLVQRVAQAGIAVPSILQELQACGAAKVSELQPAMRQMFRDKLVALTSGAIQ